MDLDADVAVVVDVDVIVSGVNSILTVESSRETKKFRFNSILQRTQRFHRENY